MALYYELQVFKDVYTLVQKVFLYTQEFVSAQESVNATGGYASGGGGLASYSVGQVAYTTNIVIVDLSKLSSGIYYVKTKTTANKVYKQ
ncbi:MAG: hypothetical protein P8Q41_13695 [Saprospiraceae bacterium]|nr:hypothetical protein [Saprospiraceae bacterium]